MSYPSDGREVQAARLCYTGGMDTQTPRDEDAAPAEHGAEPTENTRDTSGRFTAGNTEGRKWAPGESGNRDGRPRAEVSLTTLFKRALDAPNPDGEGTVAQAIAATVTSKALKGDMEAVKYLGDRTEGKPRQSVQLSEDGGNPLHHQVTVRTSGRRRSAASDAAEAAAAAQNGHDAEPSE